MFRLGTEEENAEKAGLCCELERKLLLRQFLEENE